jgi:hypothetical protein
MITDEDLIERDEAIAKLIRVDTYQKLKKLLSSIDNQLQELNENNEVTPKNARQGAIQYHNKVKKPALENQRKRLVNKMKILEEIIKKDIESEK